MSLYINNLDFYAWRFIITKRMRKLRYKFAHVTETYYSKI